MGVSRQLEASKSARHGESLLHPAADVCDPRACPELGEGLAPNPRARTWATRLIGIRERWVRPRFLPVFFHAKIGDKVCGQFLIRFDVRMEFWRCALLSIFHCRVERLPERRIGFNALFHYVSEGLLLGAPTSCVPNMKHSC